MALPAMFNAVTSEAPRTQREPEARLKLVGCRVEHTRGAMSNAEVECVGPDDGQRTIGRQSGSTCPGGDFRLTAQATLDAVTQATRGAVRLELIGVKPLRAFDTNLVVVAVQAHLEGETVRIVGSAMAEDDLLAGTARATLHAVNRLASPLLSRLSD